MSIRNFPKIPKIILRKSAVEPKDAKPDLRHFFPQIWTRNPIYGWLNIILWNCFRVGLKLFEVLGGACRCLEVLGGAWRCLEVLLEVLGGAFFTPEKNFNPVRIRDCSQVRNHQPSTEIYFSPSGSIYADPQTGTKSYSLQLSRTVTSQNLDCTFSRSMREQSDGTPRSNGCCARLVRSEG